MRPLDHFYSRLAALGSGGFGAEDRRYVIREFARLTAPALGAAAEDFCRRALDRIAGSGDPGAPQRIGALAAFFLGEYDDSALLTEEDWEDIRETLEGVSGEADLRVLTSLMGELLSRGKLG
jgi:hypothetical protein